MGSKIVGVVCYLPKSHADQCGIHKDRETRSRVSGVMMAEAVISEDHLNSTSENIGDKNRDLKADMSAAGMVITVPHSNGIQCPPPG